MDDNSNQQRDGSLITQQMITDKGVQHARPTLPTKGATMPTRKRKAKITNIQNKPRSIRVTRSYIGSPSGNKWIQPGDYYEDDPALFGLASYLVEPMHDAVWINDIEYFETPETIADMMEDDSQEVI